MDNGGGVLEVSPRRMLPYKLFLDKITNCIISYILLYE